jgi:hypothetical protein
VSNFCQFAPVLPLAPWAGSAADRHDRRRILFATQTAAVGFASDPVNTLAPAFAHAFGRRDTVAGFIIDGGRSCWRRDPCAPGAGRRGDARLNGA